MRDLLTREGQDVVVSRGTSYENRDNLAPIFFAEIVRRYQGTRMGRQELRLRKSVNHMQDALATLERKVRALAAQPITVPSSSYRIVEKAHDDLSAQPGTPASANGNTGYGRVRA